MPAGQLAHGTSTAADIVVVGSDEKRTYDCHGGDAVVNGGDNAVDAGSALVIGVLGSGNRVTWTEGPGGARPAVSNLGQSNVVKRRP